MLGESAARTLVRALRKLSTRLLHPIRRRQALAQLRRTAMPARVLFVCHGNICRSPYAAAVLRRDLSRRLREVIQIDSAGFIGPDRSPPVEALDVAAMRGIDLASHRSRLLIHQLVWRSDLIVVMEPGQRAAVWGQFGRTGWNVLVLGDLDPLPAEARAIQDPIEQPREVFERSYDRIDRCVAELTRVIGTRASA